MTHPKTAAVPVMVDAVLDIFLAEAPLARAAIEKRVRKARIEGAKIMRAAAEDAVRGNILFPLSAIRALDPATVVQEK